MDDVTRQSATPLSVPVYCAVNDLEKVRSWFGRDPMRPIVYVLYSPVSEADLEAKLGMSEYSYFFVREIFRAALAKNSRVIVVTDPSREVDRIFDDCEARGLACIFLSFAPPHRTSLNLRCPTIPVFAWEFDTIPDEVWWEDERNNWAYVLARLGGAITHSEYSARAIKRAMGSDFPVISIPAPVWDKCQSALRDFGRSQHNTVLSVDGTIFDNRINEPLPPLESRPVFEPRRLGFLARLRLTALFALQWYRAVIADLLPTLIARALTRVAALTRRVVLTERRDSQKSSPAPTAPTIVTIASDEIVYTSVLNPNDGRKNWQDIATAFCTALEGCDDATLLLKFVHKDCTPAVAELKTLLSKLRPHRCRVLAIGGYLDKRQYDRLIGRTGFVVNASLSEGQCLPLMEFMSSGKPAIAPVNTAMEEYVDARNTFVVDSSPELCCWPHDARFVFRARRYRINWESLVAAFERSYAVAKKEPTLYAEMAKNANMRLREFCSEKVVLERLVQFLRTAERHLMPFAYRNSQAFEKSAKGVVSVDDIIARLASKAYFQDVPIPKLESDYDAFDPSRGPDARQLFDRFGILTRGASHNMIYVHKDCGPLRYASTFTFNGDRNIVIMGESNGFHGSLIFEGEGNTVVLLGNHGRLGLEATLYDHNVLICGRGAFAWGLRVWVYGGTSCTIGDDCLISENVSIRTSDHHSIIDLNTKEHMNLPADIEIGKHVWVGPNCVIGKGVKIGAGSILATNSVVTHSIEPRELWGGVPARQIRREVSWVRSLPPDPTEIAAVSDLIS